MNESQPHYQPNIGSLSHTLRISACLTGALQLNLSPSMKHQLVNLGLYARLEAKPGKEKEVAEFLESGLPTVEAEFATVAWAAMQFGPSTFGIFSAFPDETSCEAHMSGKLAKVFFARAPELFATTPVVEKFEVLAVKLPL